MSDLHWACEHCGHHLAIDEKGVGRRVACKACGNLVVVPPVATHWYCTECHTKLGAALHLAGKIVHCDECGAEQTVPQPGKTTGAVKIDLSTFSKHHTKSGHSNTTVLCPQCGAKVPIGATLCSHCMFNLEKDKPVSQPDAPKGPMHDAAVGPGGSGADWKERAKIAGLLLVILIGCFRLFGDRLTFFRRASRSGPILAVQHTDYYRVFEYFVTLLDTLDQNGDLQYVFFLARSVAAELQFIGGNSIPSDPALLREVSGVFEITEDYRRLQETVAAGGRLRGREASAMADQYPELRGLVQGSGAGASLDPQQAVAEMDIVVRMALRRGIDALSQ